MKKAILLFYLSRSLTRLFVFFLLSYVSRFISRVELENVAVRSEEEESIRVSRACE